MAHALLQIKSLKDDMPDKTFEQIIGWIEKAVLEQKRAAAGHERS